MSKIQLPDCSKLVVNWKMAMTSWFSDVTSLSKFFWRFFFFVFLVKFSYWSKFHVSIITCSGVITISLRDSPEIWKSEIPYSEFFPNIWRLGRVRNTKFGTNVFNKMLLNPANARVTAFTISELWREHQQGDKITPLLPHPD